jgi:hypothetical protein
MRGRTTLEKLNKAIEEVQHLLAEKYKLLALPDKRCKEAQLKQREKFKQEETKDTAGCCFFSDHDLKAGVHLRVDASGKAILNVLRQIGRVSNVTAGGFTRWVVSV